MIKVTLEFPNEAAVAAYFYSRGILAADAPTPAPTPAPAQVKVVKAVAPKPAVAASEQAPTPAPAASPSAAAEPTVDYATLQKAVFALANTSADAARKVAASFNAKTFKDLTPEQWGPALTAVNSALEGLKAAA